MENSQPYVIEYDIPENTPAERISRAARLCVGMPILIHKESRNVGASILSAFVQPNIILCEIGFTDEELLNNMHDFSWVAHRYHELDPILTLLGEIH